MSKWPLTPELLIDRSF